MNESLRISVALRIELCFRYGRNDFYLQYCINGERSSVIAVDACYMKTIR
jgi:hypothetical protein